MIYYKLTDARGCTYGGTAWDVGVTHQATGTGTDFCCPDLIHLYSDPILAVMLDPIHGNYLRGSDARLLAVEAEVVADDHGLKLGCKAATGVEWLPLPVVTTAPRVRFGILAALAVSREPPDGAWRRWAAAWLDGTDRSSEAAQVAGAAAWAATEAAWEAADAATWAARAADAAAWEAADAKPLDLVALAHRAVAEEAL